LPPPPCGAEAPAEEPTRAQPAGWRPPREDVLRLKLDDFLAPGPAVQQPQQGDFQQAMSMEEQMQMMQWICSVGIGQMQTDPSMGAAGFLPQPDGQACGMPAQASLVAGQVFAPQDYLGQLHVNPSAVPPVADAPAVPFVPSGAFDVAAGAFQMPFMPAQAPPPPPLQPVPALFAQPAQAQATGTVLQAPAQPPQPQAPQGPQQLQQMAMQIQKLLQMQQPGQPVMPLAQPPGPQMPQMLSAADAAVLAAAFPAVAGPGTAPAPAPAAAAASVFAPSSSGARWADEQEAMTAPMALPPFPVPMFPPAAEPGAAAQPPAGRISISVGHFPEPGAATTTVLNGQ